jgi:hypothetical protein
MPRIAGKTYSKEGTEHLPCRWKFIFHFQYVTVDVRAVNQQDPEKVDADGGGGYIIEKIG